MRGEVGTPESVGPSRPADSRPTRGEPADAVARGWRLACLPTPDPGWLARSRYTFACSTRHGVLARSAASQRHLPPLHPRRGAVVASLTSHWVCAGGAPMQPLSCCGRARSVPPRVSAVLPSLSHRATLQATANRQGRCVSGFVQSASLLRPSWFRIVQGPGLFLRCPNPALGAKQET